MSRPPGLLVHRVLRWSLAALVLLAVIVVPFVIGGEALETWSAELVRGSHAGVAAAGLLLLTLDVFLPIPASLVLTSLGTALGAYWGSFVGALGMTLGCWLALLLGRRLAEPAARQALGTSDFALLVRLFDSYGLITLAGCRAVPVLAEASVIAAGAVRLPVGRTLLILAFANVGVSSSFALLGSTASDLVSFLVAALGSLLVPALALLGTGLVRRTGTRSEISRQEAGSDRQIRPAMGLQPRPGRLFEQNHPAKH